MPQFQLQAFLQNQLTLIRYIIKWIAFVIPLGLLIGSANALFITALEEATLTRYKYPFLLFFLPLAGIFIAALYKYFGQASDKQHAEAGNNLIMDEIHKPGGGVPARMAPLVLVTTVITHLFGGSAGREGTAVQMGGSIAAAVHGLLPHFIRKHLTASDLRTLLIVGVAAGFGGVFGVPFAGAIFAIEVLAIGRLSYEAFFPALLASIASDWTVRAWGVHHTLYPQATAIVDDLSQHVELTNWLFLLKVLIAAACFGLVASLFATLTHTLSRTFSHFIKPTLLRPLIGGLIIIAFTFLLGTRDYLGLGTSSSSPDGISILSAFNSGGATPYSWLWKLLFTAITLSSGFKGGEVTPLFFIGACLGNTLAWLLGAPVEVFAALGLIGVFAGATNTPIACTIMGIELFGARYLPPLALTTITAYLFSGHASIYSSQRLHTPKHTTHIPSNTPIRDLPKHIKPKNKRKPKN
ncbi:H(+)/Cl(-) exchange transporter ClcA [Poriferisphaera corsica]|uniref:H(+)/Cl(-) exchange transporter ClcA n=1 Tax=Poriferisphaera corsica TaxID=2528020 RepID=A0A517YUD5_9BACT|nr:voltage-gated chloride channel family protein [Poriferisphaera corsica]QDU33828.1 H(+)/Cl(-) exchange transporter ClcA [Poriferisphaera corsica]